MWDINRVVFVDDCFTSVQDSKSYDKLVPVGEVAIAPQDLEFIKDAVHDLAAKRKKDPMFLVNISARRIFKIQLPEGAPEGAMNFVTNEATVATFYPGVDRIPNVGLYQATIQLTPRNDVYAWEGCQLLSRDDLPEVGVYEDIDSEGGMNGTEVRKGRDQNIKIKRTKSIADAMQFPQDDVIDHDRTEDQSKERNRISEASAPMITVETCVSEVPVSSLTTASIDSFFDDDTPDLVSVTSDDSEYYADIESISEYDFREHDLIWHIGSKDSEPQNENKKRWANESIGEDDIQIIHELLGLEDHKQSLLPRIAGPGFGGYPNPFLVHDRQEFHKFLDCTEKISFRGKGDRVPRPPTPHPTPSRYFTKSGTPTYSLSDLPIIIGGFTFVSEEDEPDTKGDQGRSLDVIMEELQRLAVNDEETCTVQDTADRLATNKDFDPDLKKNYRRRPRPGPLYLVPGDISTSKMTRLSHEHTPNDFHVPPLIHIPGSNPDMRGAQLIKSPEDLIPDDISLNFRMFIDPHHDVRGYDHIMWLRFVHVFLVKVAVEICNQEGRLEFLEKKFGPSHATKDCPSLLRHVEPDDIEDPMRMDCNVFLFPAERVGIRQCLDFLDSISDLDRDSDAGIAYLVLAYLMDYRPTQDEIEYINNRRVKGEFGRRPGEYPPPPECELMPSSPHSDVSTDPFTLDDDDLTEFPDSF